MNKQSIREIFDDISLSLITFLDNHVGITDIEFIERQGVAQISINKWEEENAPYCLPDDYKAFLQISDGLELKWKIQRNDSVYPLGCMHLNKLRDIKRFKITKFKFSRVGEEDVSTDEEDESETEKPGEEEKTGQIVAFDMDSKMQDGRLGLLFKDNVKKPQIWFQDLSCSWFFIANTFTDYFRLMIMHLGIPHWQYAFTSVGLDPLSWQWFRFLSPERLAIDIENRKNQEILAKKKHKNDGDKGLKGIDVLRNKKRKMKLKAKGTCESILEKFHASSSKSAKFARATNKKKEEKSTKPTKK